MTEFYKSIPEGIREKLKHYQWIQSSNPTDLKDITSLYSIFTWKKTPEGHDFWFEHYLNKTFPIWSEEQNRFINP